MRHLNYPPRLGTVVICNYDTGFRPPEMIKTRLAIVISPRLPYRDGLCTVVPLSTTPSKAGIRYQCKIELPRQAPSPFEGLVKWAKADMLATVCYNRLSLPYSGRNPTSGRRDYLQIILPLEELKKVRVAVLNALGLDALTGML